MLHALRKLNPEGSDHAPVQEAPFEVVAALLAAGANPDQVDYVGCTALHIICRSRASEVSRMPTAKIRSSGIPSAANHSLSLQDGWLCCTHTGGVQQASHCCIETHGWF